MYGSSERALPMCVCCTCFSSGGDELIASAVAGEEQASQRPYGGSRGDVQGDGHVRDKKIANSEHAAYCYCLWAIGSRIRADVVCFSPISTNRRTIRACLSA